MNILDDPRFALYEEILLRENAKYNLTAITDPAEIRQKHFADSLALLDDLELPLGAAVLDVGSGAGFPGVPLALARPGWRVTLLEATAKKARFLRMLASELELPLAVVNARAETAAHDPALRARFDLVVARAVAALPLLCELCLPYVKEGGIFAAYKGAGERAGGEVEQARQANAVLGARCEKIMEETTAYGQRTRIMLRKLSQTPTIYPRNHGAMRKKPL
jgi:16S rRNA (guanine527-N7)-methyltransferase